MDSLIEILRKYPDLVDSLTEVALSQALLDHLAEELEDYSTNELKSLILDWAAEGTVGYHGMSRETLRAELIKKLEEAHEDEDGTDAAGQ